EENVRSCRIFRVADEKCEQPTALCTTSSLKIEVCNYYEWWVINMSLVPKNEDQETNSKKKDKKQKGERKSKSVQPGGKSKGDTKAVWANFLDKLPKQLNPAKAVGVRLFLIFFVAIMFFVLTIGIMSSQMAKG